MYRCEVLDVMAMKVMVIIRIRIRIRIITIKSLLSGFMSRNLQNQ